MDKVRDLTFLLLAFSGATFSGDMGRLNNHTMTEHHPWLVTGSIGFTDYQNMFHGDGETVVGRFALGKELFSRAALAFGLELGVQNGNAMRLDVSQETLDVLGGLPIQSTMKPMLDLLVTAKTNSLGVIPLFAELKGGIAYRHWQFEDRDSINDQSNIAGEVQAGLGYLVSDKASLGVFYQGVFGGNPDFQVNALNQTGLVKTIPIQNGVLLSLTLTL
jgi:hypothetical protein